MSSKARSQHRKPPMRAAATRAEEDQQLGRAGSQTKAEATRQQILLAAACLFREKGYKATTLRDVAEHAGMGAGSLYYHFDSKDAILREVLEVGIATIDEAVRLSLIHI